MSGITLSVAHVRDAAVEASGCRLREVVVDAARYLRRPPFRTDTEHLEPAHQDIYATFGRLLDQDVPPTERLVLSDAMVAGQGSVITRDAQLIHESAVEFLAHHITPDGLERGDDNQLRLNAAPDRIVRQPTLLLQRPWYMNYGHWLVDSAALLALVSRAAMPAGWQVVIGEQASGGMRNIILETIALLAPGVAVLERPQHEVWQFDALHYVTPVHVPPLYKHPLAIATLRQAVLRDSLAGASGTRKLFVTRGPSDLRALSNEDEVTALLVERGYEICVPEKRNLREQAKLFRSARAIVGVKGAALTNAMFCTAGAHLVALSPGDFPDPFFWDLVSQNGVRYSEIFGALDTHARHQSHNAFHIDGARLRDIIDAVEDDLMSQGAV